MTPPSHLKAVQAQDSLETHVAVCEERYAGLTREIRELKAAVSKLVWTIAGGFGSVLIVMLAAWLSRIP